MSASVTSDLFDSLVLDERARRLLFTDARTANSFSDAPVSDEQLRAIYELAKFGPTAANTNPLRVLFLRHGEQRDRLVPLMLAGNQAKTASAPVVAVLAADLHFHEHMPTLMPVKPELKDYFAAEEAAREATAHYNATLQTGYFLLAVRAAGLAAGPMAGFDKTAVDATFFAGTHLRSHLVVNLGTPGENPWFDRLPRLAYADAVTHA